MSGFGAGTLEVVDDPADGLDVGVLGLPLIMAAVVSTFHHVHPPPEVGLLVHHPAETQKKPEVREKPGWRSGADAVCVGLTRRRRTP